MKATLFFISIFFLSSSLIAQDLTIRQVFDYAVGDEFHSSQSNRPPNAFRFKVIGKYYSETLDTVFYVRKIDSYGSNVVYTTPPHLEYDLGTSVDTIFYTSLDSSVATLQNLQVEDSCDSMEDSVFTSPEYCNRRIYQNKACINCCFEGEQHELMCGEGLGFVYSYYGFAAENYSKSSNLFYFKKGIDSCGTPDKSNYTGITENLATSISIWPNPAQDRINISGFTGQLHLNLRTLIGELIQSDVLGSEGSYTLPQLSSGLYLLELKLDDNTRVIKLNIN